MNIKEYISSGIVESYVLGLASEQERTEFEQLCLQYPELAAARNEFEEKLEKQAFHHAITPPAFLKEKVMNDIHEQVSPPKEAKIITMDTKPKTNSGLRFVAAASVILFLAAGYFAYDFYNKKQDLEKTNLEIQSRLNQSDSILKEQQIINDPNVKVVNLNALTPTAPSANIYWDTTNTNVFLVVKNMPVLASDKQYQLWSLIDSNGLKPTSLGLFDGGKEKIILKMNGAQKADAFAITIENKGNTGGPDLKQLQNMGKTKL
ncbi:MAG TPA: anti-sigma factor [Chitinophagaceae bacterium]|nr:anti-sigma factor [Chitinophagaceae bacterium]